MYLESRGWSLKVGRRLADYIEHCKVLKFMQNATKGDSLCAPIESTEGLEIYNSSLPYCGGLGFSIFTYIFYFLIANQFFLTCFCI